MIFLLSLAVYMAVAQVETLSKGTYIGLSADATNGVEQCDTCYKPSLTKHFSDKFSCFYDQHGVYEAFSRKFYPDISANLHAADHYCCGYMANGLKQCDKFVMWSIVEGSHFSLCEKSYTAAFAETRSGGSIPKLRRDLCCENDEFTDCSLCKNFMVWDFTVSDTRGGDQTLATDPKVYMEDNWRTVFDDQGQKTFVQNGEEETYPPYAYGNSIYPAGYARGKLREFNDPPICVYAPNVAGRVIEIKVEPEEYGNICVDDLHEDALQVNEPGVTQTCDDTRLRTCFPDAASPEDENGSLSVSGFAFLISCSESCANGDVDLWFRVRASINKWSEAGNEDLGTDRTELNTEMWCMWGIQDMRDQDENFDIVGELADFPDVDGNFAKWDIWPSDLAEEKDPVVRPVQSGVFALSTLIAVFLATMLF